MAKPQLNDAEIARLIEGKVTAEETDSGWMIALLLMRALPIMKEMASKLDDLKLAIAEHDVAHTSLSERLTRIAVAIDNASRSKEGRR